jgi:serine phosphatase RsbU (regulator of sigma subunit)
MSLVAGSFDLKTGELHFITAGHPHPIRMAPRSEFGGGPVTNSGLRKAHRSSPILGEISSEMEPDVSRWKLAPGESVIAFSDGLFENKADRPSPYTKKMLQSLERFLNIRKADLVEGQEPSAEDVYQWSLVGEENYKHEDDVAILKLTFRDTLAT